MLSGFPATEKVFPDPVGPWDRSIARTGRLELCSLALLAAGWGRRPGWTDPICSGLPRPHPARTPWMSAGERGG
eukprot:44728-Hanusia_phi.AAC.2